MKKKLSSIICVFISLLLLLTMLLCNSIHVAAQQVASESHFIVTEPESPVTFHTQLQQEAIEAGADNIGKYSNMGEEELSIPEGITLSWIYEGEKQPDTFTVALSQDEEMEGAASYEVSAVPGVNNLNLQNLLLGTTYYYTVSMETETSPVYSFTTSSQGPRNLFVEGVTNVRDIGGWETQNGGMVRQGMVIRCGQLNTEATAEPCITTAGIDTMRNVLGVRTEIDYRTTDDNEQGGITQSPLGSDVNYYSLPIHGVVDLSPDVASILETFRLLTDPGNYPVIYHCKIGTDRTGMISYLILALCGVSIEDIHMDFAFSNLGLIHARRAPHNLDKRVSENYGGEEGDLPETIARNYLLSIGMTEEELDAIVEILVENP